MGLEIEKKFLVNTDIANSLGVFDEIPLKIKQCYFEITDSIVKRVRRVNYEGSVKFIVTEKSRCSGMSRQEHEYPVSEEEATCFFESSIGRVITKKRYNYIFESLTWEIDVFERDNLGLVIAEIELVSELQEFKLPEFVMQEVTDDIRYYNHFLSQTPYITWPILKSG